jgi:hypothetical protein
MRRPVLLSAALLVLGGAVSARAQAPATELEFRRHVAQLVQGGRLAYDEGLLVRFQRVFAPEDLPPGLRGSAAVPARSATGLVIEYRSIRDGLPAPIVRQIDRYLGASAQGALSHETAHFRLTYDLTGPHAVDPADANGNGAPDYVERIGGWAEAAWGRLFDDAGFTRPSPASGKIPVSFREMQALGYTVLDGGEPRIILHRDYAGVPENRDPEGSANGAAKVSAAHELKHVSQWEASGWSEGGWLEADATWAEDFVFDATDDYLRELPHGSPVSHPDSWIAGGASYEDCLWQHLLAQRWGTVVLVDFFARRAQRSGESVLASFEHALARRGGNVGSAARELAVWSYFCGGNAVGRPAGFEEAAAYPTPPFAHSLAGPSETVTAALAGLGTHYVLVSSEQRHGKPFISFSSDRSAPFAVHAMTLAAGGARAVHVVPVGAPDAVPVEIPAEWSELPFLVVAVTNSGAAGRDDDYFLSVDDDHAVDANLPVSGFPFALEASRPNPFRDVTEISFSLPSDGPVRLAVYDVAGRLVQRLAEGERLPAGRHGRTWDGKDQSGRFAAPGVYYYRLEAGELFATRSLLLLR